ncbi:MAG: hypothetical protein EAZ76_01965 [Nostocales cyanobacterium]|nr:MAG: hypothetical protein EAZ87_13380 [Nostocales cyanobacterium]TAF20262.1 MAG: hypothetical protein EAZ76_01965 [Nostocales cyanobacterium]
MNQPETKNQEKSPTSTLSLDLIEISIILVIPNFRPDTINVDFLKYSGIIPDDWELATNPVINNFQTQINFTNKIRINAENNRIIFTEAVVKQEPPKVPHLTCQFITSLNKANYQALGFNTNHLVVVSKDEDLARRYITEKLLKPGIWYKASKEPMRASVNYYYTLDDCQLNLNVSEARLQIPEQSPQSALLFTSNFNYQLQGETSFDKQQNLIQTLEKYESIIKKNQKIIYAFFN